MARADIISTLRADHRRVLTSLTALEAAIPEFGTAPTRRTRGAGVDRARALRPIVRRIARQFDTHLLAEDESLFPILMAARPDFAFAIEPLREEHTELKAILLSLARLLEQPKTEARDEQLLIQWRDFAALLRIHIRKEEAAVFGLAETTLTSRDRMRVAARRFPRRATSRVRNTPGTRKDRDS